MNFNNIPVAKPAAGACFREILITVVSQNYKINAGRICPDGWNHQKLVNYVEKLTELALADAERENILVSIRRVENVTLASCKFIDRLVEGVLVTSSATNGEEAEVPTYTVDRFGWAWTCDKVVSVEVSRTFEVREATDCGIKFVLKREVICEIPVFEKNKEASACAEKRAGKSKCPFPPLKQLSKANIKALLKSSQNERGQFSMTEEDFKVLDQLNWTPSRSLRDRLRLPRKSCQRLELGGSGAYELTRREKHTTSPPPTTVSV
jgi:hypothetical protein